MYCDMCVHSHPVGSLVSLGMDGSWEGCFATASKQLRPGHHAYVYSDLDDLNERIWVGVVACGDRNENGMCEYYKKRPRWGFEGTLFGMRFTVADWQVADKRKPERKHGVWFGNKFGI